MSASPIRTSRSATARTWNVILWVLQIIVAAAFLYFGTLKLTGALPTVILFDKIGFGQWFRYFTGGMEILGAVMLLIPRFAAHGALLIIGVMIGALITNFALGVSPQRALILVTLASIIAWGRRDRLALPLGMR